MSNVIEREFTFPVTYPDQTIDLRGFVFQPETLTDAMRALPPVVFTSGFTGGVAMYGQLFGRALAAKGYRVVTYDVSGFFTNKAARNTAEVAGQTLTTVSLEDQKTELLALIDWTRDEFGAMPAVASWAMGSVASLAAVNDMARAGGPKIAHYFPMSYTRIAALQGLRADADAAHAAIMALDDDAAIAPFDTGTEATRTGFYPLDPATQDYVDVQLGNYTEERGVDRWPGARMMTAKSYKDYMAFDPESQMDADPAHYPPALFVHGLDNTLHMPSETERLHRAYPGPKTEAPLMIEGMEHGQQLMADNPVFHRIVDSFDKALRSAVV